MKHIRWTAIVAVALVISLMAGAVTTSLALASTGFSPAYQEGDEGEEGEEDYFCSGDSDFDHPVAAGIAELFDADYEEILGYFCDGSGEGDHTGFGQIMLAYLTAGEDGDVGTLLERRTAGEGWGQIWQDMGLIGKPEDAVKPEDAGKPDDVGPPDDAGAPDGAGRP